MEEKTKILVIDDDEAILEVITFILKDEGYDVLISDGSTSVDEQLQRFQPDLVILDVLLSGKSGIDICKTIKENPLTADTPVIMFSAHSDGSKVSQECGADAFMEKPFEIEKLTKLITKVLKKKKN